MQPESSCHPERMLTNMSRMFDHFAHLGGAAFGVFWYNYGAQIWFTIREWDLPVAYFFHGSALKKTKAGPTDPPS